VLGRMGGEEFAVLLPHTEAADAVPIAERLCAVLAETPIFFDGQAIAVTMSIGVAEYSTELANGENLLRQADLCLYEAKRLGRNRVESVLHTANLPSGNSSLNLTTASQ